METLSWGVRGERSEGRTGAAQTSRSGLSSSFRWWPLRSLHLDVRNTPLPLFLQEMLFILPLCFSHLVYMN